MRLVSCSRIAGRLESGLNWYRVSFERLGETRHVHVPMPPWENDPDDEYALAVQRAASELDRHMEIARRHMGEAVEG
ncbi:hypothetical protein [Desulfohalovibrio reitneri]|uniref:hypothetical protein n=1 Tax=Desulfohalovibrio reitneri TaxID=1307759 RepID=UPI0004A76364|nr:hypothetical protein [Desulfohalovibrio reitneri]